ncbi:MAG: SOS response-associated peptidase [Actinomycetales bacterium]
MCGRYAASAHPDDLVEEFDVDEDRTADGDAAPWAPKYNTAPTDTAPVVLTRRPRGEPDAHPVRQLRLLRWGLVPSWSKSAAGGAKMINARAETLFDAAAYKRTALVRRCLVPADGWYEWQASPTALDRKGKPRKQPFFVHRRDRDGSPGSSLAFAGLYEFWKDRSRPDDDPAAWLVSYTIITTAAEPGLDRIHDRMPVVLDPDHWGQWLDPDLDDPAVVRALLASPGPGRFAAYPVSGLVSSVRNDGPQLLDAAPAEDLVGVVDPMTGEIIG